MIKTNSSDEFGTRPLGSARTKLSVELPNELNRWVDDFDRHLSQVVGLAASTRHQYCFYVRRFLAELRVATVPDRSVLRAEVFTTFVRQEAGRLHGHSRNQPGTAMRAWLRYLVFCGVVNTGLEAAIPSRGVNKVSANSYHKLYGYEDCSDHCELTQ
ncbi:hypothetical protein VOM14_30130 [Paraburkholderia sp. MPAMCS5]|uniref:hypothetical protein n=1 Tax=Paraburkholderia sp. MPAMCS5 TaxID=3112563 RepID=UPI002E16DE9C|nr:hypothetical protein [Paraburkholderia sp. MPAMCS5]